MKLRYRIVFALSSLLWFTFSILPLLFEENNNIALLSPILSFVYSPVCHQDALKLICFEGNCSVLCARCEGIYFGVFSSSIVALLAGRLKTYSIKYLFLLSSPMFADVIFVSTGFYNYSHLVSFLTGLIFGYAAFYYFYIGIQDFSFFRNRKVNEQ